MASRSVEEDQGQARQRRHYAALLQLLTIDPNGGPTTVLAEAADLIGRAVEADHVDIFLYDDSTESLVAVGPPHSPLAVRQRAAGLDRLALADGGHVVHAFRSGLGFLAAHLDDEPSELGSRMLHPIRSDDAIIGVLQAVSVQPDRFSDADLNFLEAAASWMGMVSRATQRSARSAAGEGRLPVAPAPDRLTRREREVATLVARGLSNQEIADQLVLVPGTVSNHVEHILRKLGFTRRVQVAVWATECGLYRHSSDRN